MFRYVTLAVWMLPLLFTTGCSDILNFNSRRLIKQGEEKYEAGQYRDAIRFYERAIDGTAETADIHYRLAIIYDERLKSPLDAIHHYGRYIELAPEGAYVREARDRIKEAELEAITRMSNGAPLTQREGARLRNENLELRKQALELRSNNSEMREQIADLRREKIAALKKAGVDTTKVTRKPIPQGARTYMVEPGDTLAAISRKFYKTSTRWKDIQDANFNTLEGTVRLKPGQILIIPD